MSNTEILDSEPPLYSLIPIDEFKSVLGIDDRDDKLVKFSLVTSTLTIESYCKRKLIRKKHFENIEYIGDLLLPLREYPVIEVLGVFLFENPHPCGFSNREFASQTPTKAIDTPPSMAGEILEPDLYNVMPDCGTDIDIPFTILLSKAIQRYSGISAIKAVYWAGYEIKKEELSVPADLSAACLELASWNFNRYKTKRIGMSGNIKGAGIQGEHFELSMPENVKILLEPYRRKTI